MRERERERERERRVKCHMPENIQEIMKYLAQFKGIRVKFYLFFYLVTHKSRTKNLTTEYWEGIQVHILLITRFSRTFFYRFGFFKLL